MWRREIKIPEDKIASIGVPVLLIRGDRDMIKLNHTISMYEALRHGQLCICPNVGREMPDQKGEVLCRIAIEFLSEKSTIK